MQIFGVDFSIAQIAALVISAFLAGFTKTGIIGLGIIVTPLMASVFPAGASLGFMLPLYLLGDVISIIRFNRRVLWRPLLKALPWGMVGAVGGWWIAGVITRAFGDGADRFLRTLIGCIMGSIVALSYYVSRHPELVSATDGSARMRAVRKGEIKSWYAAFLGSFAGFASMLTNSGGPIWGLYFSSLGMEVKEVVGAGVWCFFIISLLKIPLSANLGFLNTQGLLLNLLLAPLTVLGVVLGARVSGRYSKETFGRIIQVLAAFGAVYMILF